MYPSPSARSLCNHVTTVAGVDLCVAATWTWILFPTWKARLHNACLQFSSRRVDLARPGRTARQGYAAVQAAKPGGDEVESSADAVLQVC